MNWIANYIPDGGTLIFKGLPLKTAGIAMLCAAVILGVAGFIQQGAAKRWIKGASSFMRLAVVALILLALMDPVVRTQELIPQQSFLAHVFDISGSMNIADMNGTSRIGATKAIAASGAEKRVPFDELYRHVEFVFDTETVPLSPESALAGAKRPTDLEAALRSVQFQVTGLPLSGVVLYSDGNSTTGANVNSIVEAASELNVPIYTVGTTLERALPTSGWRRSFTPRKSRAPSKHGSPSWRGRRG